MKKHARAFTIIEVLVICAIVGILAAILIPSLTGCDDGTRSTDKLLQEASEQSMKEANAQIGMPAIKNFQERKLAKYIFELRDREDLVCFAYVFSQMTGKLIFVGKCIGYGLPYSIQYTNPQKLLNPGYERRIAMPQQDPNGLFMPEGLSATWLMMIDPETGDARPVYFEPAIVVSPFPLH